MSSSPIKDIYDALPYPNTPIQASVKGLHHELFKVNLTTAQYVRTHQWMPSEGRTMLNAGCGSGLETLVLAEANPGAQIVGIDISAESVKIAEQRLRHHGFSNVEFYVLDILDIDSLKTTFDFISCSDTLYLLDQPIEALKAFKSVLNPDGLIRANLHNLYCRRDKLEMQEAFRLLGQYDIPRNQAVTNIQDFMTGLTPQSWRKILSWDEKIRQEPANIINNFLLWGDKAYSIPQAFRMVQEADLSIINLVDFPSWDWTLLLPDIPNFMAEKLQQLTLVDQLHIFELMYPNGHRLIDFWAEHRDSSFVFPWSDSDWQQATLFLNPVLANCPFFGKGLKEALDRQEPYAFSWLGVPSGTMMLPPEKIRWLLPLIHQPMTVEELYKGYEQTAATSAPESADQILQDLQELEASLFILIQTQESANP